MPDILGGTIVVTLDAKDKPPQPKDTHILATLDFTGSRPASIPAAKPKN
jgi:hypothetical protein